MLRKLLSIAALFAALCLAASPASAQWTLLASYPMNGTAEDATGTYDPIILFNTPYEGGGVYVNGIYPDGTPGAAQILTPPITALDFDAFTFSVDFKIAELPDGNIPVIVAGDLHRWGGAVLDPDGKLHILYNDIDGPAGTGSVSLDTWHYLVFTYDGTGAALYLDYELVATRTFVLDHDEDRVFTFSHGGSGTSFKGHIRNLTVYNGVLDPTPVARRTWGAIKAQY